jgi:hypothetical protein
MPTRRSTGCPRALAAAVHQSEPLRLIEREHRDIDLLDDAPEQRRGLQRVEALRAQRVAEDVHFQEREAEPIVGTGAARADRVVPFAQCGEQVGDGLERPEHALADQRGADQLCADHQRERHLDPGGRSAAHSSHSATDGGETSQQCGGETCDS